MRELSAPLAEQFEDTQQQEAAVHTGIWVFIATEVMFFGGLFLAYVVYRTTYFHAFTEAARHSNVLIGTVNTAILLTSSFTIAAAVLQAKVAKPKSVAMLLAFTSVLGLAFLALKGLEYSQHISDHLLPGGSFQMGKIGPFQMFWWLYFVMTGLHALHVIIGLGIIAWQFVGALGGRAWANENSITATALYWHFVDAIWVFLYPLFYLIHQ